MKNSNIPPGKDDEGEGKKRRQDLFGKQARILEILNSHGLTVYQITLRLFSKLDPLNFFLAISEVIGHLELLEVKGHANSTQREGVYYWHKS